MVEIRPYKRGEKDIEVLRFLHKTQNYTGIDLISDDHLPEIGYIAFHVTSRGEIPVAAGFLRMLEGGFAQIDTLASNATLPGAVRHVGIDKLVKELINTGKNMHLNGLMCFTRDLGILRRAVETGFHVNPHVVITLSLKD